MKVVEKQLKELRMYENNPRNNDQAVEEVAKSIKEFGFKVPMVIDANNVIVCGHTRYKACLQLGISKVPCVVADDLTPEQIRAFRLVENKTNELATWDSEKLDEELDKLGKIDFDSLFERVEKTFEKNEWFDRENRWDDEREEGNDEYNEFLDKFEQPKTTDDCYTPDNIYEAVADYVAERFNKKKEDFVRPFYPGGDFENETYKKGCVVVDNPPFSILAKIIDFYLERKIDFFLFAPGISVFNYLNRENVTSLPMMAGITYENGAIVQTAFLTNLFKDGTAIDNDPIFRKKLDDLNEVNEKAMHRKLPKYDYPYDVLTASRAGWLSKHGQRIILNKGSYALIDAMDEQKTIGKTIYGKGLLLSERAAAERAAAERAAAERAAALTFKLSDREKGIQRGLQ